MNKPEKEKKKEGKERKMNQFQNPLLTVRPHLRRCPRSHNFRDTLHISLSESNNSLQKIEMFTPCPIATLTRWSFSLFGLAQLLLKFAILARMR